MNGKLPLTGLITALAVIFIVMMTISAEDVLRAIPEPGTPDQGSGAPAWAAEVESRVRRADPAQGAVVYSQYGCETCHQTPNGIGPHVVGIGQRAATRR